MQSLHTWFASSAGQELAEREVRLLNRRLAGLYATRVLQVGAYGAGHCPAVFGCARQWIIDNWSQGPIDLHAEPEILPLANESVDVVILIHQLEFSERPHQIMREAVRVLAPEGHLLVLSFNPLSLWGLRRWLSFGAVSPPWSGRYLSALRLSDWMLVLGLTPRRSDALALLPPFALRWLPRQRLHSMPYNQSLGPLFRWVGGVNLVIGQKRVPGSTYPPVRRLRKFAINPRGWAGVGARHTCQETGNEKS